MQVTNYRGGTATKGVNVRFGEFSALFDPQRLTYVAAWQGELNLWASRRYGITSGVKPSGRLNGDLSKARWSIPGSVARKYRGFYRHGERVVFVYSIGGTTVYDSPQVIDGEPGHLIGIEGELPAGVMLDSPLARIDDLGKVKALSVAGARNGAAVE